MLLTVPVGYSYDPDHALRRDISMVQRSMQLALEFLEENGDEEALLYNRVAWVVELKRAMKRVNEKSLQRFLFDRFLTHSHAPVDSVVSMCKDFAEWLQSSKELERRKLPWDRIYMVHVPDGTELFSARYDTVLLFGADEHLEIL